MFLAIAKLLKELVAQGRNQIADAGLFGGRLPNRRSGWKSIDVSCILLTSILT